MSSAEQNHWTAAEYLAFERESDTKHEYADGQIIAMTGASWNHNLICVNTSTSLNIQLAEQDCRVTSGGMRLKTASSYRYPDVMVICGEPQFADERTDTIINPIVVVEVLSKSTALTDRNEKLDEYLKIESLRAYILISQDRMKIECYLRQDSGGWLYTSLAASDGQVELPAIGCHLALADVYNKITLNYEH